ncbi:mCG148163 [Mus musculus]|nr:mCG148163 [Mus musculus]
MVTVPGFLIPGFLVPGFLVPEFLVPGFLVPGLLVPGLLVPGFGTNSYTHSRPARKDATNRNLLRQKLYCLHLQEPESKSKSKKARKRTRTRKQERENKKAREEREQESKNKREKKQEQEREKESKSKKKQEKEWQNPVPFKENYPPPRTYYSLIGCSPSAQLSSRERQNTWRENCPCTCADYVYHLEHSCQRHLIMANVRAAPNRAPALALAHILPSLCDGHTFV